ncbi:MAG: DEAD/DEAH box helicase [Alphaproteobacteria bacterium]|nr:DEAD/DEAH box helicase [Alphaproteobacteria bacterium]
MRTAIITIRDEVNIKIQGLELDVRRKLVNTFKYDVPGARYLPAVRLGRWDGKVSYFQLGGSTYVNLLPEIIPILESYNYDVTLDDLRDYSTNFTFDQVTEDTFAHKNWSEGHPMEGQPIKLRDYQVEIINNFLKNPQSIQEIATGAGKTIMTAALSQRCEAYGRTIIIVPNKTLVTQTEKDYRGLGLDVGVYFGDRKEWGKKHTICTWQSLNILLKNTKNGSDTTIHEFIEDVVGIIVDEVHMAKADALKTLLTGVMSRIPIRWGLTGTVPKEPYEFQALKCSLGPVINQLSASELQGRGVLARCHVNIVQLIDHAEFSNYQSELKFLLEEPDRLDTLAQIVEKVKATGNTLVLVDRVAAGHALVDRLGDRAVFVSGATKGTKRDEEYAEVAEVDDKIIVATYGVAAVGINIPRIFNLVLVEPGKSFVRVIQSIGRGIRKAEDKDFVQIWDITSTCKFAKRHLTKRKQFYKDANYPFTQEKLEWK